MNKFLLLKDNFLIERECNFLINLHKANIKNTKKHPTGNGYTTVLPISKGLDKKIDELIERKELFVNNLLSDVKLINVEIVQWDKGVEMKPHYDITSNNIEYKAATVCYLNNNYTGGETIIENNINISPELGRMIVFDGLNYKHGVNQITENIRYTFISWFIWGEYGEIWNRW